MTKGKHQIAIGFDGRREQFNSLNNQASNGQFTFSGGSTTGYSGDNLADLEMGHLSSWDQSNALSDYIRQTVIGFYVQDSWRATSHLTVNAGFAGSRIFPWQTSNAAAISSIWPITSPAFTALSTRLLRPVWCSATIRAMPTAAPSRTSICWTVLKARPRVGSTGRGKQTISAAFGLLHDANELFYPERWTTNAPYASSITLTNPAIAAPFSNPWNGYTSPTGVAGDPFPGIAIFPSLGTYVTIPPNVHATYMMQWSFSYSRQIAKNWLATANYIGNRTNHILGASDINMPTPSPTATSAAANEQARRPLTLINATQGAYYGSVLQTDDGATAHYNALLLRVEHRLSNHVSLLTNYTWSHCISDYDFNGELSSDASYYQNPLNRDAERSDCNFDRRQVFNTSMVAVTGAFLMASSTESPRVGR